MVFSVGGDVGGGYGEHVQLPVLPEAGPHPVRRYTHAGQPSPQHTGLKVLHLQNMIVNDEPSSCFSTFQLVFQLYTLISEIVWSMDRMLLLIVMYFDGFAVSVL